MLRQNPEDIISAIEKAIASGWRKPFFKDGVQASEKTTSHSAPQPVISLTSDEQQLNDTVCSFLGNEVVRPGTIHTLVQQMHSVYDKASHTPVPYFPDKHPNDHLPWERFFREWIEFLEEKQHNGFTLRSVRDLELSGCRWREYMQRCENYTSHNWTTGKRNDE
jgi:hypothetical protein